MAKMMDDSYNPQTGSDQRWDQFASKYKWKKGWQRLRLFGLVYSDARHNNIKTKTNKAYNEFCHGYDVENDRYFGDREARCECCRLGMQTQIRYFVNALAVEEWERRPAVQPSDWNPIYLLDLPPSLHTAIMGLKALNGGHNVGDALKGAVISINYNPDAPSPAQTYSVSMDTKNWAFTEDMCKFGPFHQDTPDGKRELRKGTDKLPPAWVYYPCRSTRDKMEKSLRSHGYYGSVGNGGSDTNADVEAKGKALLSELSGLVSEGEKQVPKGGVKELAKLREEANGVDNTPPPPKPKAAAPAADAVEASDVEIPF